MGSIYRTIPLLRCCDRELSHSIDTNNTSPSFLAAKICRLIGRRSTRGSTLTNQSPYRDKNIHKPLRSPIRVLGGQCVSGCRDWFLPSDAFECSFECSLNHGELRQMASQSAGKFGNSSREGD